MVSCATMRGQILTTNTSCDVLLHKEAPFLVAMRLLPISGIKSPKKPTWDVKTHFQARLVKYYNIEITASTPTKLCNAQ